MKSAGARVTFLSILPDGGKGAAGNRCIMRISPGCVAGTTMRILACDNGTFFADYIGGDGIYLSRRGKGIFSSRVANLVKRALN